MRMMRTIRNGAFALLAGLALATSPAFTTLPAAGGDGENCGPYWCGAFCSMAGGYRTWRECDPGSCTSSGCTGGGENCYDFCIWCDDEGGGMWFCEN
jgi:hypothetical protein